MFHYAVDWTVAAEHVDLGIGLMGAGSCEVDKLALHLAKYVLGNGHARTCGDRDALENGVTVLLRVVLRAD